LTNSHTDIIHIMSESSTLKKPKWDSNLPDYLAFRKYIAQVDTYAIQLTGPRTPDGWGLSHALYSPARFLAIKGANPQPIADPGPYAANMVGGVLENHKELKVFFNTQESNLPVLANAFENGLPDRVRKIIEVDFSLDHLTLQEQVEGLQVALPMKPSDLDYLRTQISTPYLANMPIETHVQMQRENLAHVARAGQAIPALDAVARMWQSFTSTTHDAEDFAVARTQYLIQHGDIGQQTPDTLAPFLINYVRNQLPHHQIVNKAARAARAVAHAAQVVPVIQPLAPPPPMAAPAVAVAQHAPQPGYGGRGGRGGRGAPAAPAAAAAPPPQPLPGAPGYYCWTHSPCFHYSISCRVPAAGHRWDATLTNQLGGAPA